ncbi:MAG: hypothetical protein QOE97_3923, partial [Pseudonocardiales bacterium]|nr:hypothetical protein [Pseudonocardiales bacterium]
ALMRAVVEERLGAGADVEYARNALRALGVPDADASAIAAAPLPAGTPA